MTINRDNAVHEIGKVIHDLSQFHSHFQGGQKHGIVVWLSKAQLANGTVDESKIRELYLNHTIADSELPVIQSVRHAFWSLLPDSCIAADNLLKKAATHFEETKDSSFIHVEDGIRFSVFEVLSCRTIRIDVS